MFAKRFVVGAAALLSSGLVSAQSCSGGAGGGMDATGNDCNPDAWVAAVEGPCETSTPVSPAAAACARLVGMQAYGKGRYAEAMSELRHAAELGDARAAKTLSEMYRAGEPLYGDQVPTDLAQSARYASLADSLRRSAVSADVAAGGGESRR